MAAVLLMVLVEASFDIGIYQSDSNQASSNQANINKHEATNVHGGQILAKR